MNNINFQIEANGKVIDCEIFFTFTKNNKNYIVYTDHVLDMEQEERILASTYYEKDGKIILNGELTDEEYDIVDKEMERFINE